MGLREIGGYGGNGVVRNAVREGEGVERTVDEPRERDGGIVGNGAEVQAQNGHFQQQTIEEYERTHAVRAALESLWRSEEPKVGLADTVSDVPAGGLEEMEVKVMTRDWSESVRERPRPQKVDPNRWEVCVEGTKEGKRDTEQARVRKWGTMAPLSLPDRSASASSVGISDMLHRSQRQHHCILDGHLFTRRKAKETDRWRRDQKTINKVREESIKCCRCGRKTIEEDSWVCEVKVCGMEACYECAKRWELERRMKITESWLNTKKWEGYGVPRAQ